MKSFDQGTKFLTDVRSMWAVSQPTCWRSPSVGLKGKLIFSRSGPTLRRCNLEIEEAVAWDIAADTKNGLAACMKGVDGNLRMVPYETTQADETA